ncbi:MAG: hypothetical protein KME52_03450 [Desmonostoc geniculatum HA4340-LM1]|jgi:hemoglobin-like flavoprotein|nr:hypothetical protein [Desmonostoc geniculatum HA4340-LM1]
MSLNIEILEQSFAKVKPHADEFAASFYNNLFQAHPELKSLFANTDMANQQKKLLSSLLSSSTDCSKFDKITVLSSEADTRVLPSGANANPLTPALCPIRFVLEEF